MSPYEPTLEGDTFDEVEPHVSVGDVIHVTYLTEHGTATVSGEVTEIRTRHGRGNQSIRFENTNGTYVVDDYDPDQYPERIAGDKERSLHVKKDLNPGGAVNFIGLNNEGEPADVEIKSESVTVRRDDLEDALDLLEWGGEPTPQYLERLETALREAER